MPLQDDAVPTVTSHAAKRRAARGSSNSGTPIVEHATARVYSYLRFSDPKQANGASIARQTERAEKWAKDHGMALDDGVVARFDITPQWVTPNRLDLNVVANRRDGTRVAMNFAQVWTGA